MHKKEIDIMKDNCVKNNMCNILKFSNQCLCPEIVADVQCDHRKNLEYIC